MNDRAIVALLFLTFAAIAQTDARLEFEVASVKPSMAASETRMRSTMGGITLTGVTLKLLLQQAYDVRDFQLSGASGWISSDRYDIVAKAPYAPSDATSTSDLNRLTNDQRKAFEQRRQAMMQALLADRFQLKIHRETKEVPIYTLIAARGGPKLSDRAGEAAKVPPGTMHGGSGLVSGSQVPMSDLVFFLGQFLHRTVVDRTGMTGKYDFELKWTPDQPAGASPGPDGQPLAADAGPSIFTAVQEQLGLKLEPGKGPVEMIVIDHASKPSEN